MITKTIIMIKELDNKYFLKFHNIHKVQFTNTIQFFHESLNYRSTVEH